MGAGSKQCIQSGGLCNGNRITGATIALTHTIHNDQNNRLIHKYFLQIERLSKVLQYIGCTILHHNDKSYNPFLNFLPKSRKTIGGSNGFQHFPRRNRQNDIYKAPCTLSIVPFQLKSKANMKEAKIHFFQQQTAAPMTQLPDKLIFGRQDSRGAIAPGNRLI
jgi:hypothetical protein